jgi:nucleotide-binding universal stress UspA family protein
VLVVGSHGRGPLGRVAIGSVSEALARRCSRPLVVVPRVRAPASVG